MYFITAFIKFSIDSLCIALGLCLAMLFRFDNIWFVHFHQSYIFVYFITFCFFYFIKKSALISWSYISSLDILNIVSVNFFALVSSLLYFAISKHYFSRTLLFLTFIFSILFQLTFRFIFKFNKSYKFSHKSKSKLPNTLLCGLENSSIALLREAASSNSFPYNIRAILDDDIHKIGTYINGIKVLGNFSSISTVVRDFNIQLIIVCTSDNSTDLFNKIILDTKNFDDIKVKVLPSISKFINHNSLSCNIRDVRIEDLLGRKEIFINKFNINSLISNNIIFVSGAAGSIGSELCRQILKFNPKLLVAIDCNENDLYFLQLELNTLFPNSLFQPEICNVRDFDKLNQLFNSYKPSIVFHAAAHKHVPLMEHNPEEAIKNNIFGTDNIASLSIKHNVHKFLLISTDKAVNPTNVMGASKRACELLIKFKNINSSTNFMAVRFGNVLGSNGSVIPIFKNLIAQNKNLTLTHKNITRYFMTIPEAAQLVLEATAIGHGGEIFILDMGKPIKIFDLAKSMIKLANSNVGIDIVGLRPGEKLFEELLYNTNDAIKTSNNLIFITNINDAIFDFNCFIKQLHFAVDSNNHTLIKSTLKKFITTYKEVSYEKNI